MMGSYHGVKADEDQKDQREPDYYGTIRRRLWHRPDFRALSFEAKATYAYMRTCPAGNIVGVFPLRPEDIHDDLGLGPRLAGRALCELEENGFIVRERHWVWIVDALETTPNVTVANRNHRIAALKFLANAPDNLAFACRKLYGLNTPLPDPIGDPIGDRISDPIRDQIEIERKREVEVKAEKEEKQRTHGGRESEGGNQVTRNGERHAVTASRFSSLNPLDDPTQ